MTPKKKAVKDKGTTTVDDLLRNAADLPLPAQDFLERYSEVSWKKWRPSTAAFSMLIGGIHDGEVTTPGLHE